MHGGEIGADSPAGAAATRPPSTGSDLRDRAAAGGRWLSERWLVLASGLAAALPVIVSMVHIAASGWVPLGDDAMIAIRSFDVLTAHPPLVGMPSSGPTGVLKEQTYHLGPLLFWLFALPARFLGSTALPLTAGLVNVASVMGSVGLAHRRGGRPLMFAVALAIPLMLASLPAETYSAIWNPSAPLLPFTLLIFLAWSVACGDFRLLPLTVLVGSFVAQCHLIFAFPAFGALAVGVGGLAIYWVVSRRGRASPAADGHPARGTGRMRWWVLAAVVVGLACWSAPLIEEAGGGPGNLTLLRRAAAADVPTLGHKAGERAVVLAVGVTPWWLRDVRIPLLRINDLVVDPSPRTLYTGLLVLAGLAAVALAGWRRGRGDILAAAVLALVLCAALELATASVPTASFTSVGYALRWASPVGMWAWLALGWSLASLLAPVRPLARARRRALALASGAPPGFLAVAGLVVVTAVGGVEATDAKPPDLPVAHMHAITARLEADLPAGRPVRVDGTWGMDAGFMARGFQLGIVYALRRDGWVVRAPEVAALLGSEYQREGYDRVVQLDVDGPPIRRGRVIARAVVATGKSDNPFSKDPPTRLVRVAVAPAGATR